MNDSQSLLTRDWLVVERRAGESGMFVPDYAGQRELGMADEGDLDTNSLVCLVMAILGCWWGYAQGCLLGASWRGVCFNTFTAADA